MNTTDPTSKSTTRRLGTFRWATLRSRGVRLAGLALLCSGTLFSTCTIRARDAFVGSTKAAFIELIAGSFENFLPDQPTDE